MSQLFAFGIGLATTNRKNEWLEAYYSKPIILANKESSQHLLDAISAAKIHYSGGNQTISLDEPLLLALSSALVKENPEQSALCKSMSGASRQVVLVILEQDSQPTTAPEAYLKLQLLSHRLVKPHEINLSGIFSSLPNLAWTNEGPIDLNELAEKQLQARVEGRWLNVKSVDKFPQMTDYVVPNGVRIADTARVRLGAYVGSGTTIMHEGFINFNAGTAGTSMIEGRISAGVFVGKDSDLGGGSSTMGTLSGGGDIINSVGENCLIGANAGIGIALGDRCTIEAGLYITAGTKVSLLDDSGQCIQQIKARELSGKSDMLFRRNSVTGAVECKSNQTVVELNEALHSNN